jgi:hypothetical protein
MLVLVHLLEEGTVAGAGASADAESPRARIRCGRGAAGAGVSAGVDTTVCAGSVSRRGTRRPQAGETACVGVSVRVQRLSLQESQHIRRGCGGTGRCSVTLEQ